MAHFDDLLIKYDELATAAKVKFERDTWLVGIGLGVAAVVVFALAVAFSKSMIPEIKYLVIPILEVLFVFGSWFLLAKRANRYKTDFLKKRHFAEYLRINQTLSLHGMPISYHKELYSNEENNILFELPPEIQHRSESYTPKQSGIGETKNGLAEFITGQSKYHTNIRIDGYQAKEHNIHRVLNAILYAFLTVVFFKFIFEVMEYFHISFITDNIWLLNVCIFLVILLPPVYAALEGIVFFSEWKRNVNISRKLNDKYDVVLNKIKNASTNDELSEISHELQQVFWQEQLSWVSWFEKKKIEARV